MGKTADRRFDSRLSRCRWRYLGQKFICNLRWCKLHEGCRRGHKKQTNNTIHVVLNQLCCSLRTSRSYFWSWQFKIFLGAKIFTWVSQQLCTPELSWASKVPITHQPSWHPVTYCGRAVSVSAWPLACSWRSDGRAREKNSRRKKDRGET